MISLSTGEISASGCDEAMKATALSSMASTWDGLLDTHAIPRSAVWCKSWSATSATETLNRDAVRSTSPRTTRRFSLRDRLPRRTARTESIPITTPKVYGAPGVRLQLFSSATRKGDGYGVAELLDGE